MRGLRHSVLPLGSSGNNEILKINRSGIVSVSKWLIIVILIAWALMPLPDTKPSYSKVLYSKEGILLSATISDQEQWCFPMDEEIPDKLSTSIIMYEDAYLDYHPGVNPIAVIKAIIANQKADNTIRGASTLAMQVMRMKNKNASRNWYNKIKETLGAIKYSLITRDKTILREWCEIAPFGGNTIGIKAASLRYFGRSVDKLSWSEYALLAVMPNGPSYANLTKNRNILRQKRDFLLRKLQKKGYFDKSELELYLGEELPAETKSIPQDAYHALLFLAKKYPDQYIFHSTIPFDIQIRIQSILDRESTFLKIDDIRNMAAVVIDIKSNQLMAYQGNVSSGNGKFSYVDVSQAPRSYGSLLKPLLYAHALETAQLLPNEMVADIPTAIGDFQPENFDKKYRGAVHFEEMLIQSLNVPAVRVLNSVGMQSFYNMVHRLNIAYLNKGADHYGLSIILGGGESSLWDLCRIYKGLAQNYIGYSDPYQQVQSLTDLPASESKNVFAFSAGTMDHLVKAMSDLTRPREEKSWQMYGTDYKIAWKTGTSYGHKDAWALGFNGQYMVGVWVGNEGGEGRFELTGITKAAPVMFKVFNALPENKWFSTAPQYIKREVINVCSESGKLVGPLCKIRQKITIEKASFKYQPCHYHQEVWINSDGYAVSEECAKLAFRKDTLFVLPSYMEYYYKTAHTEYKGIPPHDPDCKPSATACKIIYPYDGLKIFLPKERAEKENELIIKAYHREKDGKLYWFIDNDYKTVTSATPHDCMVKLNKGPHSLTITDQWGNKDHIEFEILGRE
ncbi:MAG: penicillin-binding protein 1C [Saprospiraceae bacterium]|nr:penicillin-binding protein 1C [Saprospiraceae bacterium]